MLALLISNAIGVAGANGALVHASASLTKKSPPTDHHGSVSSLDDFDGLNERAKVPAATREEMEKLMIAHRKLSVERSQAARARVNRSPAIPSAAAKSESAAPFEAADEILIRQSD